ncbi:unnamed protein product [Rhizoctonia solani]|uniref:Uncharacterized protein n=1 Tax=Rhizoctonia solani TaxID=456999 RepID=A0A8H3AMC5_9AGAM|nr:unnamed protein product [Rhizoctonia solani]
MYFPSACISPLHVFPSAYISPLHVFPLCMYFSFPFACIQCCICVLEMLTFFYRTRSKRMLYKNIDPPKLEGSSGLRTIFFQHGSWHLAASYCLWYNLLVGVSKTLQGAVDGGGA